MIIKLFPYLNFEGNGQEAAHFYTDVLGGELVGIMTYGEAQEADSEGMPDEVKNMVMNAQIDMKNGDTVMISDVPLGMGMPPFQKENNMSVTVLFDEFEEARTVFNKLSEGGKVSMELQETFWSSLYGSLTDKFGIDWQVSVEGEME